jgi:hypothetical protein
VHAVSIKSGIADVIASGTVIGFAGNPIEISVGGLKFIFEFATDRTSPTQQMHATADDRETLRLRLTNFDNPLGSGSTQPLPVGSLSSDEKQRRLYLHLRVYALGDSDKSLEYTFYAGEEVA